MPEDNVWRLLALTIFSPKLQHALANGTQPVDRTLQRLITTPLPLSWPEQEKTQLP